MFTRQLSFSGLAALVVAGWTVLVGGCVDAGPEQRLLTRGAISGRVTLVDVPGLNDLSRVRVDFGNGEGGSAVAEDGLFAVADLEPDVYTLTVTYAGGLTSEASGSAYQAFSRRVPVGVGAAVDVGDLVLQTATGSVTGHVGFNDADGAVLADVDDAVVRLLMNDGAALETTLSADGSFAFEEVPVGFHVVQVDRDGFAIPPASVPVPGQSETCGAPATVVQADAVADVGTLRLVQARAALLPGEGEVADAGGSTWVLLPGVERVSVQVVSAAARRARVWLDDEQLPPSFGDDGALSFALEVPPGAHRLLVQTTDGCRFTSPVLSKTIVRDDEAPQLLDLFIAGARDNGDGVAVVGGNEAAVPVVVEAADALSGVDEIALALVAFDQDPATIDVQQLTFEPVGADITARVTRSLVLPDEDGTWRIVAFARDVAGNVSVPTGRIDDAAVFAFMLDRTPPRIDAIVIGDGAPVTRNTTPSVQLTVFDDGSGPKTVSTTLSGVFDRQALPFQPTFSIALLGDDGDKTVAVRVVDGAGNIAEASKTVRLDRTSPTGQLRTIDGSTALASGGLTTLFVDHAADVVAIGIGLQDDACGGDEPRAPDAPTRSERRLDLGRSDGSVVVHACLRDGAGNEASLALRLTLDTTAPAGTLVVANAAAFSTSLVADVVIGSSEQPVLMRLGEDAASAVLDVDVVCAGDQGYAPFSAVERVVFGGEGGRTVFACLRDGAGRTALVKDTIVVDTIAPVLRGVQVGDGLTTLSTLATTLRIDADGAEFMRVGLERSAELAPLVPFSSEVPLTFSGADADKSVQVIVFDEAGNRSSTVTTSVTLRTRGGLTGRVVFEDAGDPTTLQALLVGTTQQVSVGTDGTFSLSGVAQGQYVLRVRAAQTPTTPVIVDDRIVAIVAGEVADVGVLTVRTARGSVVGTITKERSTDHSGITVEVVGTTRAATTTSTGVFELRDVSAGLYDVRLSSPGFVPVTLPAVSIRQDTSTTLTSTQLLLVRGVLVGNASRDDDAALGRDNGGLQVLLFGNDTSATAVTDASGAFRFDGVLPGFYSVEVTSDGYQSRRENAVRVDGGIDNTAGTFVLSRKRGAVTGVVSVEGRANPSGVRIALLDSPLFTFTDATGRYELQAPIGNYPGVRATLPFFVDATFSKTVTVVENGSFVVDPLALGGQSGVLSGRALIADALTGGHGGTTIALTGLAGTRTANLRLHATTAADGAFAFDETLAFVIDDPAAFATDGAHFAFPGIPSGRYRATATPAPVPGAAVEQHETVIETVDVVAGAETDWSVSIQTLFVLINQGAARTNNQLVRLDLGATDCFQMKLRVDAVPDTSTATRTCSTPVTNFDLGTTQGTRQVFATFLSVDGVQIGQSTDSIELDTRTQVNSFVHGVANGVKLNFGDRVTLTAKTGEPRGRAVAAIEGYDTAIVLLEGGAGCTVADVGCYGLTYQLTKRIDIKPTSPSQTSGPGTTTVNFTDESGNVASGRASSALEIAIPPVISAIQVIPDLFSQTAVVKFSTDEIATGTVRPGQAENSLCTSGCPTTALGTTHQVTITGAQAGEPGGVFLRNKAYFVRVDATDAKGNLGGSAVLRFFLQPDPPKMVVPIPMDSRVLVRWEAPPQEDLSGYFVERSENGGAFTRISGAAPYNHEVLTFDDRTVVNGRQYTYRVRAVDFFGNVSDPATTTDMAKNTDGTFDATKLAAFSSCGTVTPAVATSTAGTDIVGGVLPLCTVWTKAGSPFRVNGSIAVPTGGVLLAGPNVVIGMNANTQIFTQGRFATYGDRAGVFEISQKRPIDFAAQYLGGFAREDSAGAVMLSSLVSGVEWAGLRIRNKGALGTVKANARGYRGGDLMYRTRLNGVGDSSVNTDSVMSIVRGSVTQLRDRITTADDTGTQLQLMGADLDDSCDQFCPKGRKMQFQMGDTLDSAVFQGTSFGRYSGGVTWSVSGLHDEGKVFDFCNGGCGKTLVGVDFYGTKLGVLTGSTHSSRLFLQGSNSIADLISSMVFGGGVGERGAVKMFYSRLYGDVRIRDSSSGFSVGSTVVSSSCEVESRASADFPAGIISSPVGLSSDCLRSDGENYLTVFDFNDDVSRGVLRLDEGSIGTYPVANIIGPQVLNQAALRRGVVLEIHGEDLEDGELPASSAYWMTATGTRIGNGSLLTLPTNQANAVFAAHVVDADGNDSAVPWPVTVKNDSTLADNWMWPDRDRWRIAALRMDQLPPKTNATTVGTFRWRCFTPGCTTTCAVDPDPNADVTTVATGPCRSPVEVAGLAPGSHTFVVQPRDAAGNVIDLPQRYTWNVVSKTTLIVETAAPILRLSTSVDGSSEISMVSGDTPNQVVTCSVDGRHEVPCRAGLSISGIGANGQPARDLTIRVRSRATGQEIQPSRGIHLNDPDDLDGDGWLDRDANGNVVDPCLSGAERGVSCTDADDDGVDDDVDACPVGQPSGNLLRQVVAGQRHVCALRGNGTVVCSGNNNQGQLGDGTETARNVPVFVSGIGSTANARAVAIEAGLDFTCALLVTGKVKCWGFSNFGQLGDNSLTPKSLVPVEVAGLTNVVGLTAGGEHACAVLSDNSVRCWGRNDRGQLGDGTRESSRAPLTVSSLSGVANVAAGRLHTCAALFDGSARCWGESDDGRLGEGSIGADRTSPVTVADLTDVVRVIAGRGQSCAIRTNGALSCWGDNREAGALGNNSTTSSATPVQVFASGVRDLDISLEDSSATSATATMCALLDTGGFRCWGRNSEGQFGNGSTTGSTTPLAISQVAGAVTVATANASTCVLKTDGTVSCWGRGTEGQLGNGTTTASLTAPANSPAGWSPVPFRLGPLFNDADGDGCEAP